VDKGKVEYLLTECPFAEDPRRGIFSQKAKRDLPSDKVLISI